jgi:hypothetical protein
MRTLDSNSTPEAQAFSASSYMFHKGKKRDACIVRRMATLKINVETFIPIYDQIEMEKVIGDDVIWVCLAHRRIKK